MLMNHWMVHEKLSHAWGVGYLLEVRLDYSQELNVKVGDVFITAVTQNGTMLEDIVDGDNCFDHRDGELGQHRPIMLNHIERVCWTRIDELKAGACMIKRCLNLEERVTRKIDAVLGTFAQF